MGTLEALGRGPPPTENEAEREELPPLAARLTRGTFIILWGALAGCIITAGIPLLQSLNLEKLIWEGELPTWFTFTSSVVLGLVCGGILGMVISMVGRLIR